MIGLLRPPALRSRSRHRGKAFQREASAARQSFMNLTKDSSRQQPCAVPELPEPPGDSARAGSRDGRAVLTQLFQVQRATDLAPDALAKEGILP